MNSLAVIMSVYNNDRLIFVRESVQSILNQTFTQFDYFIVFDGPVDPEIDSYLSSLSDSRLRLYKLVKNEGLAAALNYLLIIVLQNQEYNIIARMDADDISMPERFEKQLKFLEENDGIACVGCWYEEIDETGKHLKDIKLPVTHEELRRRYFTGTPFAHPSVMYRRDLIEKAGFYPTDTILMEDNALWGRSLKAGLKFANIPEILIRFRIDNSFFRRRSGIRYGWKFVIVRFGLFKELGFPFYAYVWLLPAGITKMLPPFFVKKLYKLFR
jgi:glycosyltransferase involved in cell wall biosynthesis